MPELDLDGFVNKGLELYIKLPGIFFDGLLIGNYFEHKSASPSLNPSPQGRKDKVWK